MRWEIASVRWGRAGVKQGRAGVRREMDSWCEVGDSCPPSWPFPQRTAVELTGFPTLPHLGRLLCPWPLGSPRVSQWRLSPPLQCDGRFKQTGSPKYSGGSCCDTQPWVVPQGPGRRQGKCHCGRGLRVPRQGGSHARPMPAALAATAVALDGGRVLQNVCNLLFAVS